MGIKKTKDYTVERVKARTKPTTIGLILYDVHEVRIKRHLTWIEIMYRLDEAVHEVMDRRGITGVNRLTYHGYAKKLWKYLSRYPEKVWDKYISSVKEFYLSAHDADPDVLDEVTDAAVKAIKEILEEMRKVMRAKEEEAGVGGEGA